MWVLLFYVMVGYNPVPVSDTNLDRFDSKEMCLEAGERIRNQTEKSNIKFKCVGIVFRDN